MAESYRLDVEQIVEKMQILKCKENEYITPFKKENEMKSRLKLKHSRGKENILLSNTEKAEKHKRESNTQHRKSSDTPLFKKDLYSNSNQEMIFQNTSIISPCADGEVYSILEDVGAPLVESTRIHSSQSFALLNLSMSDKSKEEASERNKTRQSLKDLRRSSELYMTAVETQNDYHTVMDHSSQLNELSNSNTDNSGNSVTMEGSFCEVKDTSVQTDSPLRNDGCLSKNHGINSPEDISSSTSSPNSVPENSKSGHLTHVYINKEKPSVCKTLETSRKDNEALKNLHPCDSPNYSPCNNENSNSPNDSRTVISDSEDEYGTPEASLASSVDNKPIFNKHGQSNETHKRNQDIIVPDSDEDDCSGSSDNQKFDFSNIEGIHVNYFTRNSPDNIGITVNDSPDFISSPYFSNKNSSKNTPTCHKGPVPNQSIGNSLRAKFLKQKILRPANSESDEIISFPETLHQTKVKFNTSPIKGKVENTPDKGEVSNDNDLNDSSSKSPIFKSSKRKDILQKASTDCKAETPSYRSSEKHKDRNSDSDLYESNTSSNDGNASQYHVMNATCHLSDSEEEFKKNSVYFTPAVPKTPKATLSDSDEDFDAPEPFLDTPSTPELDMSLNGTKSDNSLVYTPIVPQELRPRGCDSDSEVQQTSPVKMEEASLKAVGDFSPSECVEDRSDVEASINSGSEKEMSVNQAETSIGLGEASINFGNADCEEESSDEEASCNSVGLESEEAGPEKEKSINTGLEEDESINTGLEEDGSINTGLEEYGSTKTGLEEDGSINTGLEEDGSTKTGLEEDESINSCLEEDGSINTGLEENDSIDTCLVEDKSTNTGLEENEAINTGLEEDGSINNDQGEDESINTGLEEDGSINNDQGEDESINTGLKEDESINTSLEGDGSTNTGLAVEDSIASESDDKEESRYSDELDDKEESRYSDELDDKEESRYSDELDGGSLPDTEMDRYKVIVAEPSNSWRKPSLDVSSDSDDDFEKFLESERKPIKKESVKSSDSNDSLKDFIVDDDEVEDEETDESDDAGESDDEEREDEEEEEGTEDEEEELKEEEDEDENNEEELGDVSSCSDEEMFLVSSKSPRNLGCTVISPASKPTIVDFSTPLSHRLKVPNSLQQRTSPYTQSPASPAVNDDVFKTPSRPPLKVISSSVRAVSENKSAAKRTQSERTLCTKTHSFLASLSSSASDHKCHPDAIKYVKQFKKYHEELSKVLFKLYNETVFDLQLPEDMSIIWNKRLLRTAGYCAYKRVNKKHVSRVELSTKVCDTPERVRDTLIHELCHAAVWIINNQNDGHGPLWKYWARKANSCHPDLPVISRCHKNSITTKFTYACTQCGYQIGRHSKSLDTLRKLCGYCHGTFQLVETPGSKSGTPRTPNKFAMFVKENYGSTKKSSSDLKHKDVMQLLSKQFAEKTRLESS